MNNSARIDTALHFLKLIKIPSSRIARRLTIATGGYLFLFLTPTHAYDAGDIGGDGGTPFRSECRSTENRSDVIIGFKMRSGTALDAIVPICIPLNEQGTAYGWPPYEARWVGGGGGNFQEIVCPPQYAVRHFHVYAGPWGDMNIVKHVRMTCQKLGAGDGYNVVPGQIAGTVTGDQRYSCVNGHWGTGIYGNSGSFVDRLGFVCKFTAPW